MKETKYLLDDESTRVDELSEGTHEALAEQLYKLIVKSSDNGCVIGLEGKWGAGKSTVVQLLLGKLASDPKKSTFPFYIDAWEHEGDSLRRMFLASFVKELLNEKWIDTKEFLEEKKQEINSKESKSKVKNSSSMSTFGKYVALLAVFVPLGCAIIEKTWDGVTFGIGLPVHKTFALGLALALAPLGAYLVQGCRWLWSWCRGETKPTFGWFDVNSEIQTSETTTEETEKDSVAFSQYFIDLVEGVKKHIANLVVIVDNLDRINHQDALKIWSTLQTFVRAKEKIKNVKLWVIIPYTEEGIKALWENEKQEDEEEEAENLESGKGIAKSKHNLHVGKSFLDKTFQLRLEVPDLLIEDWQEFVRTKIREVSDSFTEKEQTAILDVLCWARRNSSEAPSPREIKLYLNQIRLLHDIHSKDDVQLSSICFYATQRYLHGISRTRLESDLLNGDISSHSLPLDANNVRLVEDLCAILFHVSPKKGIQILLEDRIKSCLEPGKEVGLKELFQTHGKAFVGVLGHILSHASDNAAFSYALAVQNGLASESEQFHDMAISHWRDRFANIQGADSGVMNYLSIVELGSVVASDNQLAHETWEYFATAFKNDLISQKCSLSAWLTYLRDAKRNYGIDIKIEYSANMLSLLKQSEALDICDRHDFASFLRVPSTTDEQIADEVKAGRDLDENLPSAFSLLVAAGIKPVDKTFEALQQSFSNQGPKSDKHYKMIACLDCLEDKDFRNGAINALLRKVPLWDAMINSRSDYPKNLLAYLIPKYLKMASPPKISSEIKIRQDIISSIMNRWKSSSASDAEPIYQLTLASGDYSYLETLADVGENKLVGEIIRCALRDKDIQLAKGEDVFLRFAHLLKFVSSKDKGAYSSFFVEAGDIVQELENATSAIIMPEFRVLGLLADSMPEDVLARVRPGLERAFAAATREEWGIAFSNPLVIARVFEIIQDNRGAPFLKNAYCDAFKHWLETLFESGQDEKTISLENIASLSSFLDTGFREEVAVYINRLARISAFNLRQFEAKLVLRFGAHNKWTEADGEALCSSIQKAVSNKEKETLPLLIPILNAGLNKFKPSNRFSSTLKEPVESWLKDASDDVSKLLHELCEALNIQLDPTAPINDNRKP